MSYVEEEVLFSRFRIIYGSKAKAALNGRLFYGLNLRGSPLLCN